MCSINEHPQKFALKHTPNGAPQYTEITQKAPHTDPLQALKTAFAKLEQDRDVKANLKLRLLMLCEAAMAGVDGLEGPLPATPE